MKLIGFCVFILFINAGCKWFRHEGTFQVKYIPGWLVDSTSVGERQWLKMSVPNVSVKKPGTESIIVTVEYTELNEEKFIGYTDEYLKKKMFKVRNLGKGKVQIGEYEFTWVDYGLFPKKDNAELQQLAYYLRHRDDMYMIVCTTKMGWMYRLQPAIDTVLKSFRAF